ncbi:FtsX-like permease family protein, partial [Chloroflexota bacterium]
SSTQAMVADIENRTADTVTKITNTTGEMVAQVLQGAEHTLALTQLLDTMITVFEAKRSPEGAIWGEFSDDEIEEIRGLSDVDTAYKANSYRIGVSGSDYEYEIIGVPIDSTLNANYPMLPAFILDGRSLESSDTNGVMINVGLLDYFNTPQIGSTIKINDTEYQLVGVFSDSASLKNIYMSIEDAEEFANMYQTTIRYVQLRVYASSVETVDSVAAEISDEWPDWIVRTPQSAGTRGTSREIAETQEEQIAMIQQSAQQQIDLVESSAASQISEMQASAEAQIQRAESSAEAQIQRAESSAEAQIQRAESDAEAQIQQAQSDADAQITAMEDDLGRIENMGYLITIISAVAGILIIFGIMFYILRERTREIGIYKALGFSNGNVMVRFILEGSFVGVLGGILGAALTLASYSLLIQRVFTIGDTAPGALSPYYLVIGLGIAVVFATLGSLYPAWRAAHISPLVALQNNK